MANYTSNIVSSGTTWALGSGDTANYTSVYGTYALSNGATDNVATVYSGGVEIVSSGAVAINATVSGGALNIYSAALVNGVNLKEGGWAGVSSGGTVSNASVSSGAVLHVYDGATASTVSVFSAGRLNVRTGATAQNVQMSAGAIVGQFTQNAGSGSVSLISGTQVLGTASGLSGSGKLNIGQGGILNSAAIASGSINISSGGQAAQVRVSDDGTLAVLSGGQAVGITVENGADLAVNDGGFASDITVQQGGEVALFMHTGAGSAYIQKMSGGQAVGAVSSLDYDGALYAGSGAVLSSVTVNSGVMVLNSGAAASEIAAKNSGSIVISSGATATTVQVLSNGSLNFAEDAVATDVTVKTGGTVRNFTQVGGSDARIEKLTGGVITGSASKLDFTGSADVGKGGRILGAAVEDSGVMNVSSGGYVSGGSVLSGGLLSAGSATQVFGVSVLSGGRIEMEDGAVLQGIVQQSGGNVNVTVEEGGLAQVAGSNELGTFQLSGGTATNFVVYENGSMVVSSGASASGILIRSGGVMSASLATDVTGSSVDMGMKFSISNGVRSGLNTLSNFVLMVESGYQINGQVLRYGGGQQVSFGGAVDSTTVSSGGMLEVSFGATATNVIMKDGGRIGLDVFGSGAETLVSGTYVDSGSRTFSLVSGVASGFDLTSGSWMEVHSGGQASKTKVENGGELVISSGGRALSIVQSNGAAIRTSVYGGDKVTLVSGSRADGKSFKLSSGNASSFLLENGGMLRVFSNGAASDTIVREDGSLIVEFGGEAGRTSVSSGGIFVANSSSIVSDVTIASGADVVFHNGVKLSGNVVIGGKTVVAGELSASTATVDLYIADQTPQDYVLVDNLNAFNDADFRITISTDQAKGTYKLADGASGFSQSIIIRNTAGATQTITVGNTVVLGDLACTLKLAGTQLSLSVSSSTPTKPNAFDLNADGRADVVMTVDQPGHGADGATGAWLIQPDQTPAWGDLSQRNSGWEIFGMGRTSAGKETADVYVRSTDNVIGAWTTDPSGKVSGWETVGSFNDQTEIVGLGDFNGNGQSDLLLRNKNGAVGCYFTGGEKTGWNYFQSLGDEWKLAAVGDLNGDGRDDVVLKHDAGFAGSWLTQADGTMEWANLDTLPDGFEIVGAGDFNGDGISDVLLRTGNYYGAWLVQDGSVSSWMGLGDLGSVTVEQIADFNNDGIDDLRIRTAAGDLGTQLICGEDNLEWHYYGSVGDEWSTSLASL